METLRALQASEPSTAHRCEDCKIFFARTAQFVNHVCEAKTARRTRETTHVGGWMPVTRGSCSSYTDGTSSTPTASSAYESSASSSDSISTGTERSPP